jgi:hypothetical protein
MNDWSFYVQNGAAHLTFEDYANSRPITNPAHIWDYDRPVNAVGAFIITTAERAQHLTKHKPVYVLNHNQGSGGSARSSCVTLAEYESFQKRVARMVYEGSGLQPKDIDIFNPYDGFSSFLPFSLEAFEWHGVAVRRRLREGTSASREAPALSSGGNLGSGRTRTAMYIDSILQLRGTAGQAQVNEGGTAICGYPALTSWYLALSNTLD